MKNLCIKILLITLLFSFYPSVYSNQKKADIKIENNTNYINIHNTTVEMIPYSITPQQYIETKRLLLQEELKKINNFPKKIIKRVFLEVYADSEEPILKVIEKNIINYPKTSQWEMIEKNDVESNYIGKKVKEMAVLNNYLYLLNNNKTIDIKAFKNTEQLDYEMKNNKKMANDDFGVFISQLNFKKYQNSLYNPLKEFYK